MRDFLKELDVIDSEIVVSNKRQKVLRLEWEDIKSLYPRYFVNIFYNNFEGYKLARSVHSFNYLLLEMEEVF